MHLTKPAGVFFQLIGFLLVLLGFSSALAGMIGVVSGRLSEAGYLILGLAAFVLGIWMVKEGRQPAKRLSAVGAVKQPEPVENFITAKGGQVTYRVIAYRRMEKGELERAVWEALQSGELKEPEPGGVATLVTDIGR